MLKLFRKPSAATTPPAEPHVERYAFDSGERQTAAELKDIRGDHIHRYEKAISVIGEALPNLEDECVLDAFCGNGYGTYLLCSRLGCHGLGIDASAGAVACANAHYGADRVFFSQKEFPFDLPRETFGAATCLESLEHVGDAELLVRRIAHSLKPGGVLFISTPNERLFPHDVKSHKFHVRHYRREEVIKLLSRAPGDFRLLDWYGQDIYDETGAAVKEDGWPVESQKEKQILMFAFQKVN